jgi:hypothetical protein
MPKSKQINVLKYAFLFQTGIISTLESRVHMLTVQIRATGVSMILLFAN